MRENYKKEITNQRGNALLYVLIAVALFAALTMTLGRNSDTGEAGTLSAEQAELLSTQIINYSVQAKSSLDQMMFTGTKIDQIDFIRPTDPAFNIAPHYNKLHHPQGGGLNPGRLPTQSITQSTNDPAPGWYIGAFNNVEWTKTAGTDVILVAYQISKSICEKLNVKITGSTTIPVMTDSIKRTLINDTDHSSTNIDLTTDPTGAPICAACHRQASLCVANNAQTAYAFYSILADR